MKEKKVLIIGSGISGLCSAISLAERGVKSVLVSPFPSERSQSVLAAGGINAVLYDTEDSIENHIEDTLKGGCYIAGPKAVRGLCEDAPDIIAWLEKLGTVFTREENGEVARRAFGGQSHNRTCYCGS
ncbi:MAG: FAD-binding protein, partial [Lachnospiraceae bacterium]|nr:FAD-binding protein [Lachnospiraceae bacterium]